MTDTPKHSVSVAGIVINASEQILVIRRRDNGSWEPPGGVLELNETPEEGVVREIFEETGIKVAVDALSGIYKNMDRAIVSLVFRCHAISGEEQTSSETSAVRWFSLDEVEKSFLPAYSVRVRDAFEPEVRLRAHDGRVLI